jgi:serine/threonine protein kinase
MVLTLCGKHDSLSTADLAAVCFKCQTTQQLAELPDLLLLLLLLQFVDSVTWDRRLGMLHDVAAGMMYLHKRRYVHGDLRSPNLFVGSNGQVGD